MIVAKDGKTVCNSCGKPAAGAPEKMTSSKKKEETIVIEDNKPSLPETDVKCEKCDSMRAYWWLIQTRSADEPPTQFYKCVKCKHTWREYK
jgi:transcription factor S